MEYFGSFGTEYSRHIKMSNIYILISVLLFGISSFLNRLSVDKLSPAIMQIIVGVMYIFYIPFAIKFYNVSFSEKWSIGPIVLTSIATIISIIGNTILFSIIKGNNTSGSLTMFISLYPIVTLLLSVWFLNENISISKILGIILMLLGAIFLSIK